MNLARRAALLAGLPDTVPGTTVNRFCASSLQTIRMAFHAIRAGEGDVYVAAGVESISQVSGYPRTPRAAPAADRPRERRDHERVHPDGAHRRERRRAVGVSRDDMDRFAQRSQERAVAAQSSGFFDRELTPYTKEDGTVVAADDGPRASSTLEKLQALEPVFLEGGKVTAATPVP